MTKTIIHGCNGKMGRSLVASIEGNPEFEVVAGVDTAVDAQAGWSFPLYAALDEVREAADVVIDFSRADAVDAMLDAAKAKGLAVVVATTGLSDGQFEHLRKCAQDIPVFQAANMSLGVNLLKALISQAAAVLGSAFDIEIVEKHHTTKRDAPSGTALALADSLKGALGRPMEYVHGREEKNKLRDKNEIGIHAVRGGNIVGEHDVIFAGQDERLTIAHAAYSKALFATGALKAAAYIAGKQSGFYSMEGMIAETMG
jgi:4-hydroxy-tetrahydrodipicolinate reductase